jgi:hypothetical protein
MYAAGLLMAYLTFVPLCPPGSMDGPSLLKLFEGTFRLDVRAARDYCAADERYACVCTADTRPHTSCAPNTQLCPMFLSPPQSR